MRVRKVVSRVRGAARLSSLAWVAHSPALRAPRAGRTYEIRNPATLERLASLPDMDATDVAAAVADVTAAFPAWRDKLAVERADALLRVHAAMLAKKDELAHLITAECGKPLKEAVGEVLYSASFFRWFAEEARRTYGTVVPTTNRARRILTIHQPVGPCALITPWNFPLAMIARKLAPALAAGCTAVVKPAEDTPLSALRLTELVYEAGVPRHAVAVVTSSRAQTPALGAALCAAPEIRKLSFTGSTAVGRLLLAGAAPTVKRVSMELGGNAPFIVFEDADIPAAVRGALASKFRNAGQTCICANRLFVHDRVYDAFATQFAAAVRALQVGNGVHANVDVGPVINDAALTKAERLLSDALARGAKVVAGGRGRLPIPTTPRRVGEDVASSSFSSTSSSSTSSSLSSSATLFFEPAVLTDVDASMSVLKEEIFGPIAPIVRFTSEEEVIRLANATEAGLAGYFWTQNVSRAFRVAEALEVGMVGINDALISSEVSPFGGVKQSGIGREGGNRGIDEFLNVKLLSFGGVEP